MKTCFVCFTVAGFVGLGVGLHGFLDGGKSAYASELVSAEELFNFIGGSCSNQKCVNQSCTDTSPSTCPTGANILCKVSQADPNKCIKLAYDPFARCGSGTGYDCTETSASGCISIWTGDVDSGGDCPEANCSVSTGSCGNTRYTCTDTSCVP